MSAKRKTTIVYDCTDVSTSRDLAIERHTFFDEGWNPLMGDLPKVPKELYPESSVCIDIINKCRDLWTGWRPSEGPKTQEEHAKFAKEIMSLWRLTIKQDGSYTAGMHRASNSGRGTSFPVTSFALECDSVLAIMFSREALRKRFVEGCSEYDEVFQYIIDQAEKFYLGATVRDRQAGMKVHRGQTLAGEARAAQIEEERSPIWEKWQEYANELWDKNKRLSKLRVAEKCAEKFAKTEYEASIQTIRKRINKPAK